MLQFTVTKDFDSHEVTADEIRFTQRLFIYDASGFKRIEVVEVHDRVTFVKGRVVESALRQPSNQRHLPTFEPQSNASSGARFLPFMTFAAGLSVA